MKINILPKDVADKIAAGEVIERPVSVVKELVENAIDAGSTDIIIEITGGGKESIRVSDNGSGIDKEDIHKAFLRHATSKISKAEDLKRILTLGFRGEALASVSAVSRVEIITRTADEKIGIKLVMHGGDIISEEAIGCPVGTTIIIRDLFYNLPARLKFLKSESAESSQIIDMVSRLAITKTDIRFRMISNAKNIFSTNGNNDLLGSIVSVYKDREFKELIPCEHKEKKLSVYGYISRPSFTRANRRNQYFFVNGRPVKSSVIEKGLALGYKERLFDGRYPIAFLFIEADPSCLDVNIHPNKREVKFDDDVLVTSLVRDAVVNALTRKDAIVTSSDSAPRLEETKSKYSGKESGSQLGIKELLREKKREEKPIIVDTNKISKDNKNTGIEIGNPDMEFTGASPFDFDELVFGETIFNTYITATDDSNFYLFDQHAAHERINYERFIASYFSKEKNSQVLLLPITLDVPSEIVEDNEWQDILSRMGFSLELFGDNSFVFREIPEFMDLPEAEAFIGTFVDEYVEGNTIGNRVVIDKLITKACKSSIKAHDIISNAEITQLINDLKACGNPFSCPHGRPTFIKFRLYDIERMFKRIQ